MSGNECQCSIEYSNIVRIFYMKIITEKPNRYRIYCIMAYKRVANQQIKKIF